MQNLELPHKSKVSSLWDIAPFCHNQLIKVEAETRRRVNKMMHHNNFMSFQGQRKRDPTNHTMLVITFKAQLKVKYGP